MGREADLHGVHVENGVVVLQEWLTQDRKSFAVWDKSGDTEEADVLVTVQLLSGDEIALERDLQELSLLLVVFDFIRASVQHIVSLICISFSVISLTNTP